MKHNGLDSRQLDTMTPTPTQVFARADYDEDGLINAYELTVAAAEAAGKRLSERRADALVAQFGTGGAVSASEFRAICSALARGPLPPHEAARRERARMFFEAVPPPLYSGGHGTLRPYFTPPMVRMRDDRHVPTMVVSPRKPPLDLPRTRPSVTSNLDWTPRPFSRVHDPTYSELGPPARDDTVLERRFRELAGGRCW